MITVDIDQHYITISNTSVGTRVWALAVDAPNDSVSITTDQSVVKTVTYTDWSQNHMAIITSLGLDIVTEETLEDRLNRVEKENAALKEALIQKNVITEAEIIKEQVP